MFFSSFRKAVECYQQQDLGSTDNHTTHEGSSVFPPRAGLRYHHPVLLLQLFSIFKLISHKTHPVKTRGKHIPHTEGSWIKTLPALIKYCVRHSPGTTLFKELSVYSIIANIQDTFKVNRLGKHLISLLPGAQAGQAGFPGKSEAF